jgi:hypothetical protein
VLALYMYRALAIAVLLAAAAFPLCLEGQMRSALRPGHPVGIRSGAPFRGMQRSPGGFRVMGGRSFGHRGFVVRRGAFGHHRRFHIFFSSDACFNGRFFDPFFCRQSFFGNPFFNPFFASQPVFWPGLVDASPFYQAAEQAPAPAADREDELAMEVGRLSNEVERLREEQASRERSRQAELQPRPVAEDKTATTVLAFRDGHRSEIQNYAIVGQTLWIFTEQRARKMPLSDLDLEATKSVNADRGVEFRVP